MKIRDTISRLARNDRLFGLARAVTGGYITYQLAEKGINTGNPATIPAVVISTLFTLDGLADLVSGELHYLPERITKYFDNRRQKNAN